MQNSGRKWPQFAGNILAALALNAEAATLYVNVSNPAPAAPYTNWITAATNIQDAVDVASAGDEIVVTNGVYQTGGRAVYGKLTNRVAIDRAITVRSVNGAGVTTIQGNPAQGGTNWNGTIRCAYLTNGAVLNGFTLTNGASGWWGGDAAWDGGGVWCESTSALVSNCVVAGNSASSGGGGTYSGTLNNCILTGNTAYFAGGAYLSILNNCMLTNNWALTDGGGAYSATLNNCTLSGNSSENGGGGGACASTLNNCTLTGNSAESGGGAAGGALNNCALTDNSASNCGGGTEGSTLNHCTVTHNTAVWQGGGAELGTLSNCIVYFNTVSMAWGNSNYSSANLSYCCTAPLPSAGVGNISVDPQLSSASHLSLGSPCRGAASTNSAIGSDIDGEPWATPPAIGCDEAWPGAATGPLRVNITPGSLLAVRGMPQDFAASIAGPTLASAWDFGDGEVVSNRPWASHAWDRIGDYPVVLTAYNDTNPGGISATAKVHVVVMLVHYVAPRNPTPVSPYTNWATAAREIQSAVDVAEPGALVLVTNGVYATGGRAVYGALTNRVTVDRAITVQSVNGPAVTVIQGTRALGGTNGDAAVRCAFLSAGALLSGFTLTNGATRASGDPYMEQSGGGVCCLYPSAVVSNCLITGNLAQYGGGGTYQGTLNNCSLTANSAAVEGGGAYEATLRNCTLNGNSASTGWGGGAYLSTLSYCTLIGNSAQYGGGTCGGTLNNCLLNGNSASDSGGGGNGSRLTNCTLTGNSNGGACGGTLNNCALIGNSGSGAIRATLNNCTLTGNSANWATGGAYGCTLNNCISYFNAGPDATANYYNSTLNYCCTTPQPSAGVGNISLDPLLASASHISAGSPCRGAGSAAYTSGTDIDGDPWVTPPSIGCDEYYQGTLTGELSVSVGQSLTNVVAGYPVSFIATVSGRPAASVWTFGDGVTATNQPWTSHVWSGQGTYPVVLTAYNDSNPGGVSATAVVHVVAGLHCVAANSATPAPPYTNWTTAARDIQSAVDVAEYGALILVSDGVYAVGGRAVYGTMTNRVAIDRPMTVRSVHGPTVTIIQGFQVPGRTNGDGAIRCAYLTNGAVLAGFTLRGGATRAVSDWPNKEQSGGGVWCEPGSAVVSNCVLEANSAWYDGGGAYYGTLFNCALAGNSADYGGGCSSATLNNCTLTANSAYYYGGGAYNSTLNNCIVYFNAATHSGANYSSGTLNYCCTTPLPSVGTGNITLDPQIAGSWHLSAASPCRGAGSGTYASGTDIDGEPWASPPSIGCDEFYPGAVTGPLSVSIVPSFTNVTVGYLADFTAVVWGRSTACVWDFGHGEIVSNRPSVIHAWTQLGDYPVVLTAYNESIPAGVSATVNVHVVVLPVHYVAGGNATPVPPYTNWSTAAADIQSAVNVAEPGALVLVTNGVYNAGGRAMYGAMTNRVAVDRAITLQSVNGPGVTTIRGFQVSGTTNGDGAIRCVYLADGAVLSGFTLTSGATRKSGDSEREQSGGGVWCESPSGVISNCVVTRNAACYYGGGALRSTLTNCTLLWNWTTGTPPKGGYGYGGGAYSATLNHCTVVSNTAYLGGGAYCGSMSDCTLTGNSANRYGGGAYSNTLNNCTLASNSASWGGGGAYLSTLANCVVTRNTASDDGGGVGYCVLANCMLATNSAANGGGAFSSTLNNCTLARNSGSYGGGARSSILANCVLTGNSASVGGGAGDGLGGGAYDSTLNNCTLTGNSATYGGGANSCTQANCIIYFNTARAGTANYTNGILNCCCTTPLPAGGIGNIANDPGFLDYSGGNLRLQAASPCINAGNNASVTGTTDLDGRPRVVGGTVDMGAYEFQGPGLSAFIGWLQYYGLPTDGSADFTDPDGDHYNNWQEWQAGSNPTNALSAAPFITVQPLSQTAVAGSNAMFSVSASPAGNSLSYQWRFNGTNAIPAATNSWLTVSNVQSASAGVYSVLVTNVFGSMLSSNAALRVDHPPVADASATRSVVISANGVNAKVVLDGSRSSDLDSDPLQYRWYSTVNSRPSTLLATGAVAVVVLRVGVHPISLIVGDGLVESTNSVKVTVLTICQAMERLIWRVSQCGLAHLRPLLASLEAALDSLIRGHFTAARNELLAFENKVAAQVGRTDPALAQELVAAAQEVIITLEGRAGGQVVKVHGLKHGADGRAQLSFGGLAGQVHIVEASTNLVDWEMIGVAVDQGDGSFEFEDSNAAKTPNRFYRILSP